MPESYKGLTVPVYADAADGPKAFKDLIDSGPIPRFASAAERNAAIAAPVAGQLVYRTDLGVMEVFTGSTWQTLAFDTGPITNGVPTGAVFFTARSSAPSGYLLCNGGAYSRTVFSDLFAAIGTTFGAGDGVNTFNVPDLRQRFVMGVANSGTGSTLGATGGQIDHVHSSGNLATSSTGAHVHRTQGATTTPIVGGLVADTGTSGLFSRLVIGGSGEFAKLHHHTLSINSSSAGAHTHNLSGNSGSSNPPYITLHGIIKT